MLKRLLYDPIVHFLAAGLLLYALAWLSGGVAVQQDDERVIVVDRAALLTYLQYQSNAFDTATFERLLDTMPEAELQQVVDSFIAEEVLYREAATLGLERSDYLIRQRMVDKMRFLLADLVLDAPAPDESTLQAWFRDNQAQYRQQASATFTHVFLDVGTSEADAAARLLAARLLAELNARGAAFNDAPVYGDRFPFLQNYVERTLDFVGGHFGSDFANQLQQLQPDAARWQGPLTSAYGLHLVLLTALVPARDPELDEVREQVLRDYNAQRSDAGLRELVENLQAQYRIERQALRAAPDAEPPGG